MKNRDDDEVQGGLLHDLPEWLEEFTDNLVDGEASTVGEAQASSSHEPPHPELPPKEVSGKHCIFSHFTKKNEIAKYAKRTNLTRAPCRIRTCNQIPRAEKFGDLITADHKVLNEEGESLHNHPYAVVVQDLGTQWLQPYPCKTKSSQGNGKELTKVSRAVSQAKACEDLSWNRCTSTPHFSETNGIAKRAVRWVKEGPSAVLLQSGLDEMWWADSMECCCFLRNVQDLLSDGTTPYERRPGEPFCGPIIPFGSMVEFLRKTSQDSTSLVTRSILASSHDMCCMQRAPGKEISWSRTLRSLRIWTREKSTLGDSMR